jgi:hypothetical protein
MMASGYAVSSGRLQLRDEGCLKAVAGAGDPSPPMGHPWNALYNVSSLRTSRYRQTLPLFSLFCLEAAGLTYHVVAVKTQRLLK